jgi:hypothetical protein
MKLLRGNGKFLEVYNIPDPPVMRLEAFGAPLMFHGWALLEDDAARERLREIMAPGNYEKTV